MIKLKILFSAAGFFKVGDYFRFKAIGETLSRRGHSVTILSGDQKKSLVLRRKTRNSIDWLYPPYLGGLDVIERVSDYLPETKLPYDIIYRCLWMARHASEYDVVHSFHIGFNTYLPFVVSRLAGRRFVRVFDWCDLWDHGIIKPPASGFLKIIDYNLSVALERLSTRSADGVTVNTTYLSERAASFGVDSEKIALVPDGACSDEIVPMEKQEARCRLQLDHEAFILGFSSFFHPDTELLIETFADVLNRTKRDVRLLFIGSMNNSVSQVITRRGVSEKVLYLGPVEHDKMGSYLSACDLLLLPYTNTPVNLARWPFKLGDYLSAGRPVVAGGYGEVKKLFEKYPNIGKTCEGTIDSFAKAILELMDDPQRIERGKIAARKIALEVLNWDKSVQRLENFYFELIQRKSILK